VGTLIMILPGQGLHTFKSGPAQRADHDQTTFADVLIGYSHR